MWSQFADAKNASVSSVYISMFDEMNEATGILNCAEDASSIPAGKYFLTLDADGTHVSSDFYLRLVNDGGKMIKGANALRGFAPNTTCAYGACEPYTACDVQLINTNKLVASNRFALL